MKFRNYYILALIVGGILLFAACSSRNSGSSVSDSDSIELVAGEVHEAAFDSTALAKDTVRLEEREDFTHSEDEDITNAELNYMKNSPDRDAYFSGIMPVIAREVPEYAKKLLNSPYDKFLVVDKASLRVLLYDRFGRCLKAYDCAASKNFGTKHKRADSRTPEGFFSVEGIYNSTDWLFTDDDGKTSDKKGQFGPRFIRIKTPVTMQVGIHGTCAPWSIGSRSSHGCVRIKNEQILELVDLVTPGMPVIILPGKRDRRVNREEGVKVPYFPTAEKYAMTAAEKKLPLGDPKEVKEEEAPKDTASVAESSPITWPGSGAAESEGDSGNTPAENPEAGVPAILPDSIPVPD